MCNSKLCIEWERRDLEKCDTVSIIAHNGENEHCYAVLIHRRFVMTAFKKTKNLGSKFKWK